METKNERKARNVDKPARSSNAPKQANYSSNIAVMLLILYTCLSQHHALNPKPATLSPKPETLSHVRLFDHSEISLPREMRKHKPSSDTLMHVLAQSCHPPGKPTNMKLAVAGP